ncbi:4a-hydroxytetrahydrobiopterin dehydratase [Paracoccus caeni]|uniref:Putative pterin-4-alpha-carbinolamine dehydratase n=1 Tax=Paracoccus caeni TaxID=657651 RepID=A0A934SDG9_9RHOB|nr:4a-hydroxytetrahydrobiopterin dehydratase [Paracoccus caeni]MBK4215877.1 4a-hydroxytetrahydrobiopterin dehydratase [Paracoccus caeni]
MFALATPVLSDDTSGAELDASSERVLLTPEELESGFAALDGWTLSEDKTAITKTFEFENFVQAFGFMSSVALVAERLDHHPDWSNIYKTVEISLNSYTLGGVTNKDIELAKRIDAIASHE